MAKKKHKRSSQASSLRPAPPLSRLDKGIYVFLSVLAFGITLGVIANIILNSPEAFIKALADTTKIEFGIMKIIFDVCWVSVSIILSLFFFGGKIVGTREGTVITAILVGLIVKGLSRLLRRPLERLLVSRPAEVK